MSKNKLPNTPWELIRLALHDLELCEASPKYKINMSAWHYHIGDYCKVCFAGAVMAKTLETPKYISIPNNVFYNDDTLDKLNAINFFRLGLIYNGLNAMNFNTDLYEIESYKITTHIYGLSPNEFKIQMELLACYLEGEYGD